MGITKIVPASEDITVVVVDTSKESKEATTTIGTLSPDEKILAKQSIVSAKAQELLKKATAGAKAQVLSLYEKTVGAASAIVKQNMDTAVAPFKGAATVVNKLTKILPKTAREPKAVPAKKRVFKQQGNVTAIAKDKHERDAKQASANVLALEQREKELG